MKNNKILVVILCILIVFCHATSIFAFISAPNDIAGHWAESTMLQWQSEGKIKGYEDNTIRPEAPITRAEFIHLLCSIITIEQQENASVSFSDVNRNDWFYNDVSKAVYSHIIAGFEDNTFRPNEVITRAQSALIISNALQLSPNITNNIFLIDDDDIPVWSKSAVYTVLNAGYISGYEDGSFGANRDMTRAEAISMLDRVDKNNKLNKNEISQYEKIDTTAKIDILEKSNTDDKEETITKTVWESGDNSFVASQNKENENKNTEKILVITKENIADFYGKTLQYATVKIKLEENSMELLDIKFTGNVEIISDMQTDSPPTVYLKGNTRIKNLTVLTPVIIKSDNNVIKTLITKSETTISGNTKIKNLKCYDKTIITDTTAIIDTAQIFSNITTENNTEINYVQMIPNTNASITAKGNIHKISAKGKGNICYIHLEENTSTYIDISDFAVVENITLSGNAQSNISIKNNGELKQFISFSHCFGTTITNYGTINSIVVCNTETVTVENAVVEATTLQNIKLISRPKQLHYKEGDTLSLVGISLLLEYQNNITQIVNNVNDFAFYHIQSSPAHNTILTAKHHNMPIKIYSNDKYVYVDFITIEDIDIAIIDTKLFQKLIQQCKTTLDNTFIQYAEEEIPVGQYYVSESDFTLLKDILFTSEKLLQKENLTQQQIQKQYDILQNALQYFEQKRILSEKVITPPILSVNNELPQYGEENVVFTIENIEQDTTYYYTLDGSEPTPESIPYTEPVILLPPKSTSQSCVSIKAIAVQNDICSAISEKIVTYSAALPIENIVLCHLKTPMMGEETITTVQSSDETQYVVHSFCWKNAADENEIVNSFQPETSYVAEIVLKANKPYAFQNDILPELKDIAKEEISILLDKNRSDANTLYVLVTFPATPPIPTEEIAEKELNNLLQYPIDVSVIDTDIPSDDKEIKEFCCEAISKSAQEIIAKYWTVEFNILGYFRGSSSIGVTGKFTIVSTIDPSIYFTAPNYVDINITIKSNSDLDS